MCARGIQRESRVRSHVAVDSQDVCARLVDRYKAYTLQPVVEGLGCPVAIWIQQIEIEFGIAAYRGVGHDWKVVQFSVDLDRRRVHRNREVHEIHTGLRFKI